MGKNIKLNLRHRNPAKLRLPAMAVLGVFNVCVFGVARATPLPQDYPLVPMEQKDNSSEEVLSEWFGTYANKINFDDLSQKEYLHFFETESLVAKSLLLLKSAKYFPNREKNILHQKEILFLLHDTKAADDPLYPYALAELYKFLVDEKQDGEARDVQDLLTWKGGSCPRFDALKNIMGEDFSTYNSQEKKKVLDELAEFPFKERRTALFSLFLTHLTPEEDSSIKDAVENMVKQENLSSLHLPWTEDLQASSVLSDEDLYQLKKDLLLNKNKQQDCVGARKLLRDDLSYWVKDIDKFLNVARLTSKCDIPRKTDERISFWHELEEPLEGLLPRIGKGLALIEAARVYFQIDDFQNAISICDGILGSNKSYTEFIQARAKFLLASIDENQNNFASATKHFEEYVQKYPHAENYKDALRKLVLIYGQAEYWREMKKPLDKLLAEEDKLALDLRSEDDLGFALFWQGRRALYLGHTEEAKILFARLSKELYSTFYGAMGHFLYEEITGNKMALEPNHTPDFNMEKLLSPLNSQERVVFKRAEKLLSLGMIPQAACEISQWDIKDHENEKILLKSLVLNATGRWLEAIKLYASLPRSFRNMLSSGFEKIIFPKRFSEEVERFAHVSDIDPYLVYALIRQESVFNPMATSPAGAMGVMQIMPNTALAISKKLKVHGGREAKHLMRKLRKSRSALYEPEVNIHLGTEYIRRLIEVYQEPVYVLASYNAGEGRIKKWLKNFAEEDMLSFIERIPYQETKNYVKLVLRNYFYYKRIYAGKELRFPHLSFVKKSIVAEN